MHLIFMSTGGGAGGSVWIKATKAFGHGSIAVNGGDGVSNGGGGSAGRISVQAAHVENWNVTMVAVGGAYVCRHIYCFPSTST